MSFQFPPNPSAGEQVEGPNGFTYEWNGTGWISLGGGGGASFEPDTTGSGETFVLQDQPTVNQPHIIGVTDGSNAAAGQIGEVISSNVGLTWVRLTNNITAVVTNISLTPGDWDVHGDVWFNTTGAGAPTGLVAAIDIFTSLPLGPLLYTARSGLVGAAAAANSPQVVPLRTCRVSLAATTTYYLVARALFPSGETTCGGNIWARRAR